MQFVEVVWLECRAVPLQSHFQSLPKVNRVFLVRTAVHPKIRPQLFELRCSKTHTDREREREREIEDIALPPP